MDLKNKTNKTNKTSKTSKTRGRTSKASRWECPVYINVCMCGVTTCRHNTQQVYPRAEVSFEALPFPSLDRLPYILYYVLLRGRKCPSSYLQ